MESAHAEAAVMLIEAGADRSRVCSVSFQRRPYFVVPNRMIVFLNPGKSGQREPGRSNRCRWARAEACQGLCYFALRPTNVTLARVQRSQAHCFDVCVSIITSSLCSLNRCQLEGHIH